VDKELFDYTIVKTIVEIARAKNIKVIAEGVETEEQKKCLEELGCDEVQGYILGNRFLQRKRSEHGS
jgi:EAL domain-containing protein (putative c-di-GMP-specific phosphodiesterase class I)